MSKQKYNGFTRAADWEGVETTTTRVKVTQVTPRGLPVLAAKCPCCGLALKLSRLGYYDLVALANVKDAPP